MVIAFVLHVALAADPSPLPKCHVNAKAQFEWAMPRFVGDLDGDGKPDSIDPPSPTPLPASIKITLSSEKKPLLIPFDDAWREYGFVNFIPVPKELLRPGREKVRVAIEDHLFSKVCDGVGPALEKALGTPGLHWFAGNPSMPENEFVFTDDPAILKVAAQRLAPPGAKAPKAKAPTPPKKRGHEPAPEPVGMWIDHRGANHRETRTTSEALALRLEAGEKHGAQQLFSTPHGVIVAEQGRFAWLLVHSGHQKLRHPSVETPHFVGKEVVVRTLADEAISEAHLSLETGDVATRLICVDAHNCPDR